MIFDYLIIGYYSSSNAGDVWLEYKTQRILKNSHSNCSISRHNSQKKYATFFKIITAKTVIFGGGSIFQDQTSVQSILYYCLLILWAKCLQKPVILLGQGYGPIQRKWLTPFIKFTIKNCAISARDTASFNVFKKMSSQTIQASDLIYLKAKQTPIKNTPITKILLANHPSLEIVSFTLKTAIDLIDLPIEIIISDTVLDTPSYVFKHVPTQLLETLINKPYESSLLISGRYHACIWASLRNIPFIGISNDPKIAALTKALGQAYISLDDLKDTPELLDKTLLNLLKDFELTQKELYSKTGQLIEEGQEHYSVLPAPKLKIKTLNLWTGTIEDLISTSLKENDGFKIISTLNASIWAQRNTNSWIRNAITNSRWITADGSGITIAAKIIQKKIIPKCRGVEIVDHLFSTTGIRIALLGAKPEIIQRLNAPNIVWKHDGYFSETQLKEITQTLKALKPDFILLALGAPKQEEILLHFKKHLKTGIGIGVGGAFDVISGSKKIAPEWVSNWHIEWLYRMIQSPKKIKQFPLLLRFLGEVIVECMSE